MKNAESDLGTAGGDFVGVGVGDEVLDATPASGINVDELDSHTDAGLDAANHAADNHGLVTAEGEAELDGLAALERVGIENKKTANG